MAPTYRYWHTASIPMGTASTWEGDLWTV